MRNSLRHSLGALLISGAINISDSYAVNQEVAKKAMLIGMLSAGLELLLLFVLEENFIGQ